MVYHLTTQRQFWADSLYMLPPFLAAAGHPDEALTTFYGYWLALFDPSSQLLSHIWDEENRTFIRKEHWGGGNGWALASIVRLVQLLPGAQYAAEITDLQHKAEKVLTGLMSYVRGDGLFHDVIDDPSTFVETNTSQMVAFSIYRGMQQGWLGSSWNESADLMRRAAENKLDDFGFVRGVCGAPRFDAPDISPEGQAFHILMETAYAEWHG